MEFKTGKTYTGVSVAEETPLSFFSTNFSDVANLTKIGEVNK